MNVCSKQAKYKLKKQPTPKIIFLKTTQTYILTKNKKYKKTRLQQPKEILTNQLFETEAKRNHFLFPYYTIKLNASG